MKNTIVKWHNNENYNLNCDIEELKKLGYVNSSYHHDLAPSYEIEGKLKIFLIDIHTEEMIAENQKYKVVINKIINEHDDLEHICSTNFFDKVKEVTFNHLNK